MIFIMAIFSCDDFIAPDCEKLDYGEVIVKNDGAYPLFVSVTLKDYEDKIEMKRLEIGETTTYQISRGDIVGWAAIATETPCINWTTENFYLAQCAKYNLTWVTKFDTTIGCKK